MIPTATILLALVALMIGVAIGHPFIFVFGVIFGSVCCLALMWLEWRYR